MSVLFKSDLLFCFVLFWIVLFFPTLLSWDYYTDDAIMMEEVPVVGMFWLNTAFGTSRHTVTHKSGLCCRYSFYIFSLLW